jgi:protein TonB
MTLAPGPGTHESSQDLLGLCLLEGDSELETRTRRVKRRAILISIVLQILFVAALVLLPLLGKTENIAARVLLYPHVPYSPPRAPRPPDHQPVPLHTLSSFFQPTKIPPTIVDRDLTPPTPPQFSDAGSDNDVSRYAIGDGPSAGIPFSNSSDRPKPPAEPRTPPPPHIVRVSGLVQEAKLRTRVQPTYPALAVQTRREGRVELHAIIATDGSIQSLEVLSGDALFIQSALNAVRQWRYRPTTLSGQPVEVDTHITVIYTLAD